MLSEFNVDQKTHDCTLKFAYKSFQSQKDYVNALTLLFMVCGDYQLDPELELEDFQQIISASQESGKEHICFYIGEEGLEAQAI